MEIPMIMTAGPTEVNEKVRAKMSICGTNPDLDMNFFEFYKYSMEKLKKLFGTSNDTFILNGEGMLGLDSACCSLIEKGDKVLCIDNGVFGNGFGPLCELYGANVTYFKGSYHDAIDLIELESFLRENNDFKIATMVHCETPSGILNPIDKIGPLLSKYKILSIVDAVASLGGELLKTDDWKLDIVLSGSQKAISSPAGLTYVCVSDNAWTKMENRKEPIPSFYTNLLLFKNWYEKKEFPYTQPVYNLVANDKAFDLCLEKDYINDHRKIANAVRISVEKAGLNLYANSGYADTVTAILVPENIIFDDIFNNMISDYNIMIAGSLNDLSGKVFRIGHMGENCREDKVYITLKALDLTLNKLGFKTIEPIHIVFAKAMED